MAKAIEVPITPAVAKWARTTSGLSIEEAADLVREPSDVLTAWEGGGLKPSLTQAKALAHVYRRPLAALLLPDVPAEPPIPVDFRRGTVARGRRLTRPILLAIRRARRMQQAAHEVFAPLGLEWPEFTPTTELPDPDTFATRYRQLIGVQLSTQLSWTSDYQALGAWRRAMEELNLLVLQTSIPIEDARAFSLSSSGPPVIVLNVADAVLARVFSLFHEFGHIALGHEGICDPTSELTIATEFEEERFCNRFAGSLLVPTSSVLAEPLAKTVAANATPAAPLGSLAGRYRVSRQVMWYRLRDVGLISEAAFAEGWALLGSVDTKRVPDRSGGTFVSPPTWRRVLTEGGQVFVSRMLEALDRRLVSPADMIDWLEMKTSDIGKLEQQLISNHE
jgi:Zn-dependent peptidase ImmA (M78 family)